MPNILGNIVQNATDINDEVIASNMLASAKGASNAYLNAALTSPTPELRSMYASGLTQVLNGYSALEDLSINRGWAKPYNTPVQQLTETFTKSKNTVDTK